MSFAMHMGNYFYYYKIGIKLLIIIIHSDVDSLSYSVFLIIEAKSNP